MLGVVGNISKPKRKGAGSQGKKATDKGAVAAAVAKNSNGFSSKAAASFYPAAERLVGVLEILDRPFGWVGQPVRRGLGWFAVATLITSAIVAVVAMLS
jgi:hypothetical protein